MVSKRFGTLKTPSINVKLEIPSLEENINNPELKLIEEKDTEVNPTRTLWNDILAFFHK